MTSMVHDLPGELEVIKAFFARGTAWVATETAGESARLTLMTESDEEFVEHVVTDPNGASALELIVLRAVVGETEQSLRMCLAASVDLFVRLECSNQERVRMRRGPSGIRSE